MPQYNEVVVRINANNPNQHIYRNNGRIYWVYYCRHNADYTKDRVRVSLHTGDTVEARARRDALFRRLGLIGGATDDQAGGRESNSLPLAA